MFYIVEYYLPVKCNYDFSSVQEKVCIKRFIFILYDLYWKNTKPQLTSYTSNINNIKKKTLGKSLIWFSTSLIKIERHNNIIFSFFLTDIQLGFLKKIKESNNDYIFAKHWWRRKTTTVFVIKNYCRFKGLYSIFKTITLMSDF